MIGLPMLVISKDECFDTTKNIRICNSFIAGAVLLGLGILLGINGFISVLYCNERRLFSHRSSNNPINNPVTQNNMIEDRSIYIEAPEIKTNIGTAPTIDIL